ncbi:hypothetical protein AB0M13_13390 [Nocardia fluminea]|uniref:hypothetical protein n=1 Tax=Nocardia fluminea TaxID=134984 RepID=UPI00341EAE50
MSEKEDTNTKAAARLSVTPRPTTRRLIRVMHEDSGVSMNDMFNLGIDVLHFVWSVMRNGGEIGVKMPDDTEFKPVPIFIPGMTTPFSRTA